MENFNMNNYLVTFERPNGQVDTVEINAVDVRDAKAKVLNANGKVDYFHSVLFNDTEEEW